MVWKTGLRSPVPMNGRELLGWNLRRLRAERGQSQEELAADTGIDRAYISEIERGLGNATLDLLDRLAKHLGVAVGTLLEEPTQGETRPATLTPGRRGRG